MHNVQTQLQTTLRRLFRDYKRTIGFIGRINTKILLTLIYFFIFPLFKLVFYMRAKLAQTPTSTWTNKEPDYPQSHEHQF